MGTRSNKFYVVLRLLMAVTYPRTPDSLERKDERPWERVWSTTTPQLQRLKLQSTTKVRCDFVMTFNKICLTFTIAAPKEYSSTWRRFILPLHLRYRKVREFFENFRLWGI